MSLVQKVTTISAKRSHSKIDPNTVHSLTQCMQYTVDAVDTVHSGYSMQ